MQGLPFWARLLLPALLLVLLPSFQFAGSSSHRPGASERAGSPYTALPTVAPQIFAPLPRDQARLVNAAVPFAQGPGPIAAPFVLGGSAESRAKAIDCLASAMWYEAGEDAGDQRAVGQVILNRVRHPAFPATVCGVVFQGAERRSGCQFTFTCDGAMARRPSTASYERARANAAAMLAGVVDSRVGVATHYHTDWVHPIWSAAMDKLARVRTHLFFRWKGTWGRAEALRQLPNLQEPTVAALATLSSAHRQDPELAEGVQIRITPVAPDDSVAFTRSNVGQAGPPAESQVFRLVVVPTESAASPALAALDLCGTRSFCKVLGAAPEGAVSFVYVRDRRTGVERTLWDCARFPRRNGDQCLNATTRGWIDFDGNLQAARSLRAAAVLRPSAPEPFG